MTHLKEWLRDFKKLSKWAKLGICLTFLSFIIGLLIAIWSAVDNARKYDTLSEQNNKTQELVYNLAEQNLYKFFNVRVEDLNYFQSINFSSEQMHLLFENRLKYAKTDWDKAVAYYYGGDFDRSLNYINNALILNPENIQYYLFKGNLYFLKQNYSETVHFLTIENLKNTNEYILWWRRAEAMYRLGNFSEAIEAFEDANMICTNIHCKNRYYSYISDSYNSMGNVKTAKLWIDKINSSYLETQWDLLGTKAGIYANNDLCNESVVMIEHVFAILKNSQDIVFSWSDQKVLQEYSGTYCYCKWGEEIYYDVDGCRVLISVELNLTPKLAFVLVNDTFFQHNSILI